VCIGDGVICDPTTHVLGPDAAPLDAITAAGDVAAWPNPRFAPGTPRRVEHFINAIEMGQAAADALLAGPTRARPFAPIPRFWSNQHAVRIQAAGMPHLGQATLTLAGDPARGRFLTGYTAPAPRTGGILVGAVAFDAPRALAAHYRDIGAPIATPHETRPHHGAQHGHTAPEPASTHNAQGRW
jgi:NADPH-dependent 2,4-dienoyl-CoA reductase/sulfur reductase-like enzyme